jgi:hypothetical protein
VNSTFHFIEQAVFPKTGSGCTLGTTVMFGHTTDSAPAYASSASRASNSSGPYAASKFERAKIAELLRIYGVAAGVRRAS